MHIVSFCFWVQNEFLHAFHLFNYFWINDDLFLELSFINGWTTALNQGILSKDMYILKMDPQGEHIIEELLAILINYMEKIKLSSEDTNL